MRRSLSALLNLPSTRTDLAAILTLALALVPRLIEAGSTYINPDESSYFTMGVGHTLVEVYHRSTATHHPPLFVFVLHAVTRISASELALRAVPILAGVTFPWFFYRWLGLVWSKAAGYLALVILAFAPHLISLSAQARGYTLALLGISVSLYCLERALREASTRWLLPATLALYLAILSEYFTSFFAAGAGVYFLLRVWGTKPKRAFLGAWATGQLGGVCIYVLLYFTHIQEIADTGSSIGAMEGFLRHGFPWPHTNALVFLVKGVVKQSTYLFASIPIGGLMLIPFAFGAWLLWQGQSPEDARKTRAILALATVPFAVAAASSFLRVHPFLNSRHTVILGIFVALLCSPALARWARSREWTILPAALLLVPLWHTAAVTDTHNIGPHRHRRHLMVQAADHIRNNLPQGAFVLTDAETKLIIDYYLAPGESNWDHRTPRSVSWTNHVQIVSYRYAWKGPDDVQQDLAQLREEFNPPPGQGIWMIEGGWFYNQFDSPEFQEVAEVDRRFGHAVSIFRFREPVAREHPIQPDPQQ